MQFLCRFNDACIVNGMRLERWKTHQYACSLRCCCDPLQLLLGCCGGANGWGTKQEAMVQTGYIMAAGYW